MKTNSNKRFKICLYFRKTGNIFETYMARTRKEAEKAVRERRLEMKNWAADEPRPTASARGWVIV